MCASADEVNSDALQYDFNLDGKFTLGDVYAVLDYYAESQGSIAVLPSDEIREYISANGDVNGDGKVTALDVSVLLGYFVELSIPGDINGDGVITGTDAASILNYYCKKAASQIDLANGTFNEVYYTVELIGDMNGDGQITAYDASIVLHQYAERMAQ